VEVTRRAHFLAERRYRHYHNRSAESRVKEHGVFGRRVGDERIFARAWKGGRTLRLKRVQMMVAGGSEVIAEAKCRRRKKLGNKRRIGGVG
jgi:hypothetical protein